MKTSRPLLLSTLLLTAPVYLCACDDESVQDGGPERDGSAEDAGRGDAGPDGAIELDGATLDAAARDGSLLDDAAVLDGGALDGALPDGALPDSGMVDGMVDGGPLDGGSLDGGSSDASVFDAGSLDGGARTTCAITSSPSVGTVDDDFDFAASSNGASCQARFDGGVVVAVPCTSSMTFTGATFGVGAHTIELLVGSGPSGPASCTTSFTVTPASVPDAGVPDAGGAATTCAIDVAPETGAPSTVFTASFSSNGSGCTLRVDGFSLGTVPCSGTYSGMGSAAGIGTHTATLAVAAGPSGGLTCSDTFVVE